MNRREAIKKIAVVGGAGVAGAALMGGLDQSVFAAGPSATASELGDPWGQIMTAGCIIWQDASGNFYVKDTGVGSQPGQEIVDANLITAYGASLGAGTTGATTTTGGLQEAINAVGTAGGGVVHIKANTNCVLSTQLTDGGFSNVIIEGEGRASVISCTSNFAPTLIIVSNSNWIVRNITIDGTNQFVDNGLTATGLLDFTGSGKVGGVKDCQCVNNYMIGGNFYQIQFISVTRGIIQGNICIAGSSTQTIQIEVTGYPAGPGIVCTEVDVIGNVCEGNGVLGVNQTSNIQVEGGAMDINIVGNVCSNSGGVGIGVRNGYVLAAATCKNILIEANLIKNPKINGIFLAATEGGFDGSDHVTIRANYVDSSVDRGIYALSGKGIIISANSVYNSGNAAIEGGNITGLHVNENTIDSPLAGGILILTVTDLQVNNNSVLGIPTAGFNGIVLNTVTRFSCTGNKITSTVSGNIGGIIMLTCTGGNVVGNNIFLTSSTNKGIWLRTTLTLDVIVAGNYIEGCNGAAGKAILEDGTSDYNQIYNNDVRNNNNAPAITFMGPHTVVKNNVGYNPINKISNPFSATTVGVVGTLAVPIASTDYTVMGTDIFITAANSSNSNNVIVVKDGAGNTVSTPGSTMASLYVPVGFKINWGAFTGTPGAVTVWAV